MLLLDTSGLLSALFPDQRDHVECCEALKAARADRLLSPFVLAEFDNLVGDDVGRSIATEFVTRVNEESAFTAPSPQPAP